MSIELEISELEGKIEELKKFSVEQGIDFSKQIEELEVKLQAKMIEYSETEMDAWARTQISRNPKRPYTLDYISEITEDFVELHGDRLSRDDAAIVGGLASVDGYKLMIIGHQKGRDIESNIYRNFGMASPEGYRKGMRLMKQAEKFHRPIITFIDTPGAYPGISSEENGIGEAIGQSLMMMSDLKVPIIVIITGEGGSGGALALSIGDHLAMLENAVYSVLSPEGFASILWKDVKGERIEEACEVMKMTAEDLYHYGIIDEIIKEPLGGMTTNPVAVYRNIRKVIREQLDILVPMDVNTLIRKRYNRYRKIGEWKNG